MNNRHSAYNPVLFEMNGDIVRQFIPGLIVHENRRISHAVYDIKYLLVWTTKYNRAWKYYCIVDAFLSIILIRYLQLLLISNLFPLQYYHVLFILKSFAMFITINPLHAMIP